MARYAYDVNTTQRYIDVHKQFQGGLKTVDTDDALGAVFLREAENVSISEFGFLEKRYGTYENFKRDMPIGLTNLQGYWEFEGYKIYVINNRFFVNNETVHRAIEKEKPTEWRYPTLPAYPFPSVNNEYRDMNAVNINRVLYIFTGFYPIYAKVVTGVLKFYWFSVDIPTFDEIVVTGHNLLEDDYEKLYGFTTPNDYDTGSASYSPAINQKPTLNKIDYYPRIPFRENNGVKGNLNFSIDYTFPQFYKSLYPALADKYIRLSLDSVSFRSSGFGASDLDFTNINLSNVDFEEIDNDTSVGIKYTLDNGFLTNKKPFTSSELQRNLLVGQGGVEREEWLSDIIYNYSKDVIKPGENLIIQIFKSTNNPNNPFDKILFSDLLYTNAHSFRVVITPKNLEGVPYTDSQVIINSSSIDTSGGNYKFTIPNTIASGNFVESYDILFDVEFFQDLSANPPAGAFDSYIFSNFFQTFAIVNELSVVRNFQDNPLLDFYISDLISGRFDFRIIFKVKRYNSEDGLFNLFSEETFDNVVSGVNITAEKLQDYPGAIDYPILKPIWTCNKVHEHFGKLMVWGSTAMPTAVFYSFPDRPTYFPSKFFLDFTNDQNSPVEAVSSYMNILVVQTRDQTWGIRGNSGLLTAPAPYAPFTINPTVGTIAYKSVRAVRNHLFFLSKQGIIALKSLYAADEQYNIEFVDRNILNIVPRDDDSAVGIQFDNQYWLNFPKQRITLRWYIDKKAWVKDTYGAWDAFNGVFKYQIVNGKLEFITHPSRFTGTIDTSPEDGIPDNPAIYKVGVDYSLPTDLGADIVALFETAFLNQNYPFHPKNYKETKMDFTVQNEYNLGRDPIYTMETNEDIDPTPFGLDIAQNLHEIIAPNLTKNHRYQLKYEPYIVDGGDFDTTPTRDVEAGTFNTNPSRTLDAMETYTLETGAISLHSTLIPFTETSENTYEFLLANNVPIGEDLTIIREFIGYSGGAALTDITYDHVLDFRTWIISEDNTLNLDNMEGYDQSKAEIPIQLGAKFGDWVFGLSDLGNKVTAIKTIKLAGRGYNVKVYFEDYSKSKWTLESLGITYKMKRPRSR
jgi:hypothetical protein